MEWIFANWERLGSAGFGIGAVIVLYTGFKRVWIWGWAYDEKAKEAEFWRSIALRGIEAADKGLSVVDKVVTKGP